MRSRGGAESFHPSWSPPSGAAIVTPSFVCGECGAAARPPGEKTFAVDAVPSTSAGLSSGSSSSTSACAACVGSLVSPPGFSFSARQPHVRSLSTIPPYDVAADAHCTLPALPSHTTYGDRLYCDGDIAARSVAYTPLPDADLHHRQSPEASRPAAALLTQPRR